MLSIARHMTADDIVEEIRMERMVHQGSFLMVERKTDVDRLAEFVDDEVCSIVNCWGRRKVLTALKKNDWPEAPRYYCAGRCGF